MEVSFTLVPAEVGEVLHFVGLAWYIFPPVNTPHVPVFLHCNVLIPHD